MSPNPGRKPKKKKTRDIRGSIKTKSNREFFKYSEDALEKAITAVRNGQSAHGASVLYNVPRSTLRDKLKGTTNGYGFTGRWSILGQEIEFELKEWLLRMCRAGAPIPKSGLLFSVKHLCDVKNVKHSFTDGLPGEKWFNNFLGRHTELSYKRSEYLSKARSKVTEEYIRKWFSEVEELLGDNIDILLNGSRNRVYNMDETALYLNADRKLVIAERGRPASKTGPCNKENLTVLVSVNAAGQTWPPPLAVWAYERFPQRILEKKPPDWSYGKSPSGWMTAEVFYEYICNDFYTHLSREDVHFPVIVFLDGHASHLSLPLSEFCASKGIIIVCLPPNCTHIPQVLDVVYFRPMKINWENITENFRRLFGRDIEKEDVPMELYKMLEKADFAEIVKTGFRCCGMYPFDVNAVDYGKLLVPMSKSEPQVLHTKPFTEADLRIALRVIESRISGEMIQIFYHSPSSLIKNVKYEALYDVWSSIHREIFPQTSTASEVNIVPENVVLLDYPDLTLDFPDLVLDHSFDVSVLDAGVGNEVPPQCLEEFAAPLSELELNESVRSTNVRAVSEPPSTSKKSVQDILNEGVGNEVPPQCLEEFAAPLSELELNESVRSTNVRAVSEPPSTSRKSVQDILNEFHLFPNKKEGPSKKNARIHYPSVVTHDLWIAMKKEKEEEAKKKENEKIERQTKRQLAKEKKDEKELLKKIKRGLVNENEGGKTSQELQSSSSNPCDDFVSIFDDKSTETRKQQEKPKEKKTAVKKRTTSVRKKNTKKVASRNEKDENPPCAVCHKRFLSRPRAPWVKCLHCDKWSHETCCDQDIRNNCA